MYSKLFSLSRGFYLAGIVLALVAVIPVAWFPFALLKIGLFTLCLFIAAVLFVAGGGLSEVLRARGLWGALLVALLPLAYVLSTAFSIDRSVAVTGFAIDPDTVFFMVLLFLTFIMSFAFFRTLRSVRLLMTVLLWALVVAAVVQCVAIVFGPQAIPFASFADRSTNLVGKWNDLGLLVGLLLTLIIARYELMTNSPLGKGVIVVGSVILALLLGLINFSVVWGLLLAACIIIAILKYLFERVEAHEGQHWAHRTPWVAVVGAIVSVLFLLFGSTFNLGLTTLFPVTSLEVRPSYSSTLQVIDAQRGGSFIRMLVGEGPNTFGEAWLMHRPAEVNQSEFWSLDFNVGFSTFITALGTVGLVGVIAWLVPLLLVLAGVVRAARMGSLNRESRLTAVTITLASLFLLVSIVLYVPSQNLIILAFVLAGAAFGFLWRQGQESVGEPAPLNRIVFAVAALVLVVLAGWGALATDRRLIAESYVGAGTQALSDNDIPGALADASHAVRVDQTGDSLRLVLQANAAQMQAIANATSTPQTELQQQFSTAVQNTIASGQSAEAVNPQDYRPIYMLGQVYDALSTLQVQGAAQSAAQTYVAAMQKDPTNPTIPLAIAQLAARQNDATDTAAYLGQALTLKPNYTDAILFLVQLDVAQNDVQSAIKAATAAVQSAPGVAPIWFELGLLYYSAGDAKDAATALTQALAIEPDYANAQYFLGLSEYALGDSQDALAQFAALNKSNPGNSTVESILANLQAGKPPISATSTPPQESPTAPVSQ